jgi:hypothetical protein
MMRVTRGAASARLHAGGAPPLTPTKHRHPRVDLLNIPALCLAPRDRTNKSVASREIAVTFPRPQAMNIDCTPSGTRHSRADARYFSPPATDEPCNTRNPEGGHHDRPA